MLAQTQGVHLPVRDPLAGEIDIVDSLGADLRASRGRGTADVGQQRVHAFEALGQPNPLQ